MSFLYYDFCLFSSQLAARLQEAENVAAEEERQEVAGGSSRPEQPIGPRSEREKKVSYIERNIILIIYKYSPISVCHTVKRC